MTNGTTWDTIEARILQILSLPHNAMELRRRGSSPELAARQKAQEIRSGLSGAPREETFNGPRLFLRVVGPSNRAYSGEWWFDADLHAALESAYSRVYFRAADRKAAIRDMLRELLAISLEWNAITEVWALELPPGQVLTGFSGPGTPQKLFGNLPLTEKGNRLLVGKAVPDLLSGQESAVGARVSRSDQLTRSLLQLPIDGFCARERSCRAESGRHHQARADASAGLWRSRCGESNHGRS